MDHTFQHFTNRHSVITGIGVVTSLGIGFDSLWDAMCLGVHGIARIARFNPDGFDCRVGGEVQDFSARDHVPKSYRKAVKVMARDTELAVVAAKLAALDAKLLTRGTADDSAPATFTPTYSPDRLGCQIGAGLIAAETLELTSALVTSTTKGAFDLKAWGTIPASNDSQSPARGGMGNLQPLWMLKYLPNMLACHVTIIHGAEGPSNTITCAEASGLLSIGESMRVIERGDADACFSGGAESKLNLMGLLRMTLAGRLARIHEIAPGQWPIVPFSSASSGSIPGEAGGLVIIESSSTAAKRGAKPYASLVGFGASQSPAPCIPPLRNDFPSVNRGLAQAIAAALADAKKTAGITPDEIDLIIPQGCCDLALDMGEALALHQSLGDAAGRAALMPLVPFIGDCSASNGGLQIAVAARCLRDQTLPVLPQFWPENNASTFKGPPLNRSPRPTKSSARLRAALVCSTSQGGQNAAIVLRAS